MDDAGLIFAILCVEQLETLNSSWKRKLPTSNGMNTTLTIKMEKKLRDDAKKTAQMLGVPLTTVMNAMLRQFVREQMVTLSTYPRIRPEKIAEWNKVGDDMDAHPEKYKSYDVEEFLALMDKEWAKTDKKRETKAR